MRKLILLFISVITLLPVKAQTEKIPLLFRLDDIGMCHSVNMAAREVLETRMPVSMSVMVPCPWFTEAVEILKQYPHVSVGIHLTLNSEWKNYRWGPVAGVTMVPSLVDSLGHFFPSRSKLFANNPRLEEIETELRAQIEKALKAGLKIDYLDYHMGAAMQTPETRAIVEKLAAMEDLNPSGPKDMSKHRQAELRALLALSFQQLIYSDRFRIVNYRMLNEEKGLQRMKRPKEN